jgi:hypothetical protein
MAPNTKTELLNRFTAADKPSSTELGYLFRSPRNDFFETGWSDWASRFFCASLICVSNGRL